MGAEFLHQPTGRKFARTAPDVSLAAPAQRQAGQRPPDLSRARCGGNNADQFLWPAALFLPVAIFHQRAVNTKLTVASDKWQVTRPGPQVGFLVTRHAS